MTWFDHHCHLEPGEAAATAVAAAIAGRVSRLICVGTDQASTAAALAVSAAHPGLVWATAGVHPHEARHGWDWLDAVVAAGQVVAIGECGLDYHYDFSPRADQRASFVAQIALAHRYELPLVIHTREAWDDTFRILDAEGSPRRTVFHCFTGGPEEAAQCLERGAYLSFSGVVTFKSATDNQAAAALCPLDRLLVETDSPYLAPVPFRGRANQPANVVHVGAAVAGLRGITTEQIEQSTWSNTNWFYDLDPDPGP